MFGINKLSNLFKTSSKSPDKEVKEIAEIISVKAAAANSELNDTYKNGGNTGYNASGEDYYSSSDLVNASVNYIAEVASLAKLKISQKDKTGNLIPIKDKKLRRLFDVAPNEFFTWGELIEQVTKSYLLTGNAFLSFEKLKNYEFWYLPTNKTKVIPSVDNFVEGYLFNDKVPYKPTEMCHLRRGNIFNQHYGSSVLLDVLKDYLDIEGAGVSDLKAFYENGSVGSGVLETEFPLTKDQIDELRTQFKTAYGASNKHSIMILPQNMKYKSVQLSPKDSMLLDSFDISEKRTLRAFRLNSQVLGGSGEQFATKYTELLKGVHETAIHPVLSRIKDQLELFLRVSTGKDDLVLSIDYSQIAYISEISQEKSDAVTKLWSSGIMSLNEARDKFDLPLVNNPNYDKRFIPNFLFGSQPVDIDSWDGKVLQEPIQPSGSTSPTGGNSAGQGGSS